LYNRVVSKVFRHKRSEVTGFGEDYIKRNFTITPHQKIWVIKTRKMRREGHVAYTGERIVSDSFWWGNLRERKYLDDVGLDGRIILNLVFR